MSKNYLEEQCDPNTEFINNYVTTHTEELRCLREKASKLKGEWKIIGDQDYMCSREQYATSSFKEEMVSPGIILYPKDEEDIRNALNICCDLDMKVALRSGGHQYCGYSSTEPANMQIDLRKTFTNYTYNKESNTLIAGVGVKLEDWARLNSENGIFLPMGVCGQVHLGGHVQTGGWGMLARSHGLLADHVVAFHIILADGRSMRVTRPKDKKRDLNNDLFFAVLGGGKGGEYGIVTQWEFNPLQNQNYPLSAAYRFFWFYSKKRFKRVQKHIFELTQKCRREKGKNPEIPTDYEFMLSVNGFGLMDILPQPVKKFFAFFGIKLNRIPMIPWIQLWMCYTNLEGKEKAFDDQWFESFAKDQVGGSPLPILSKREKSFPISKALIDYFIMTRDRELEYSYEKRSRVTMKLKSSFIDSYVNQIHKHIWGQGGIHPSAQQQIYAGGNTIKKDENEYTSYSWREQELAISYDAFYSKGSRGNALLWQNENDDLFVKQKTFSEKDNRMFAYTFGEDSFSKVWPHYIDKEEKYSRLKEIKKTVDPENRFTGGRFSILD